jgi:hypothetical protein
VGGEREDKYVSGEMTKGAPSGQTAGKVTSNILRLFFQYIILPTCKSSSSDKANRQDPASARITKVSVIFTGG